MEELLKTPEVARLLRVHPKHVYRLLAQGLPARRVGSEWRFVRADVLAWSAARGGHPAPKADDEQEARVPPPLLAANGDLVIEVLLAELREAKKRLLGFVQLDRATALERLAAREVLLAGHHGAPPPSHLEAARLARIHLVRREVGLAHPAKRKLRSVSDLARARLATRPPSAGVRAHLDQALVDAGATLTKLRVRAETYASHRDAVCAVLRGEADVALTTRAWAARVGLSLLPLATESYDLLAYAEHLGAPHVVDLCELVQTARFRRALAAVPGYDAAGAGAIRYSE